MQKAIELSKAIRKDFEKDWRQELEDNSLLEIFQPIYGTNANIEDQNKIICFIIYAYSPESLWLDLKKDRLENKVKIIGNLDADIDKEIFQEVIYNKNEIVGMCIFSFLEQLKNWKWSMIFNLLDYSSKMQRFATQETEEEKTYQKMNKEGEIKTLTSEVDIETISKVNKEKGILLEQAIAKRRQADILLEEIRKEFVSTDSAVQSDFGFNFTETSKKKDILSWRSFIQERNRRRQETIPT